MEQFEQLLTCCVCLDRFRIPKLLPCQHSFCMEPCMEGLIDYVKRQVKCPECRAEHRIPYQGVQAFPTNVTLQRFLELHIEITGELPDPTSGQIMERCGVCSEKSYCAFCAHCDKKICEDCKSAHMDILRREITRVTSQVRRGVNRLQDSLSLVEKNITSLSSICLSTTNEIDEIYRRLSRILKDRTDHLQNEIDRYLTTEMKFLTQLKDNLELEIKNIHSNCDLADKYMTDIIEWDDSELMDTKEIFLKTVEFLRNFEYENVDYNRKVRFTMPIDPNQLVNNLAGLGDLHTISHTGVAAPSGPNMLAPPSSGPGLMRSKSDHRLVSQLRQQDERGGYDDEPVLGGRKFGERPARAGPVDKYGESRYGRTGNEYDYEDNEPSSRTGKSRFRSRFVRHQHGDNDSDNETGRNVRFNEKDKDKERERVIDTEDVARGQLSGIIRLTDSPRVMKRLQDQTREKKEKKIEPVAPKAQTPAAQPKRTAPAAQRQLSEDDEISRIKRQNKGATASTTAAPTEPDRPAADRVAALKTQRTTGSSEERDTSPSSPVRRTPPQVEAESEEQADSDGSVKSHQQSNKTTGSPTVQRKPSLSTRAGSTESTTSTESSSGSTTAARNTGAAFTIDEIKQKYQKRSNVLENAVTTPSPATTVRTGEVKKPFQSRFLPAKTEPTTTTTTTSTTTTGGTAAKSKDESDSSSEEETTTDESDEEEEEEEEEEEVKPVPKPSVKETPQSDSTSSYSRSNQARETAPERSRNTREETNKTSSPTRTSGYSSPSYKSSFDRDNESSKYGGTTTPTVRSRATHAEPEETRYGAGSSSTGYTSRFLNKSKSSAIVPPPLNTTSSTLNNINNNSITNDNDDTADDSDSRYGTGRSRYLALKERRNRLNRSRSTHTFGNDNDDDDLDEPVSPTTASPSAYLASRYGNSAASTGSDLSRSRSSHALKSKEPSPERRTHTTTSTADSKDGENLSSWARYLKNKYGSRAAKDTTSRDAPSSSSTTTTPSSTTAADRRRLSLGLPLRQANELGSSDDDSKNGLGSPTSPTAAAVGITGLAGMSPRTQYLQKRRQLFQLGGRGSEPGSFTWPRGIAVGPDNSIVVADSSNHRVQVFDSNGIFVKEFGQYGNSEGEFDCLAGVAVNRIGQYIIADRYNHRIQVLDPQGRFLRQFGSQGTTDGKFNYPWGITTDALGFIYVCDKENHRVQVFQSDGTFAGKFGSCGSAEGQLEHPHYIAVSNTNRVIVSDSNNHRIQIFDVNGRVLTTFGGEGSDEGQFKFPRGVAVDDQGYICVADSGNNRIQIFHPDGSFLRAFGSWGSGDAEFKGLEGVAIMSNGNILVCDRENHRVQVF